jgi:hypothetical protein
MIRDIVSLSRNLCGTVPNTFREQAGRAKMRVALMYNKPDLRLRGEGVGFGSVLKSAFRKTRECISLFSTIPPLVTNAQTVEASRLKPLKLLVRATVSNLSTSVFGLLGVTA